MHAHLHCTHRSRSMRQMRFIVGAGLLALGSLVMGEIAVGLEMVGADAAPVVTDSGAMSETANTLLTEYTSLLGAQVAVVVLAMAGLILFVAVERRARAQRIAAARDCAHSSRATVVERLRGRRWFDTFVVRTALFASALFVIAGLQAAYFAAAGVALEVDAVTVASMLSLVTPAVLTAIVVALFSMVGLGVLETLAVAIADAINAATRRTHVPVPVRVMVASSLFTSGTLYSRPPPARSAL